MAKCKNCKHLKIDSSIEKKICFLIGEIGNPDEEISCCCYRPATNADRIRSMTDEELADSNIYFVSEFVMKEGLRYTGLDGHYYKTGKEVYEANIKWLKSEVGCE